MPQKLNWATVNRPARNAPTVNAFKLCAGVNQKISGTRTSPGI